MQKVSLWFPTIEELFQFWHVSEVGNAQLIAHKKLLISNLSERDIELACTGFNAQVLKQEKVEQNLR